MKKHICLVLILALTLLLGACTPSTDEPIDTSTDTETQTEKQTETEAESENEDEARDVPFPNYAALNCDKLVDLDTCTGLPYPDDTAAHAAKNLYDSYYSVYTNTVTDRVAQKGDYVNIDYAGYLDGVAFEGGTATDQKIFIVDDSGYIPGFVDGIPGHNVGDEFDVNVTFPADYGSADLAGKSVVFKMTLNAIYDLTLTDDTVKELTQNEYTSYEELLQVYKDEYAGPKLLQALVDTSEFTALPEESYLFFAEYYRNMYREYASYYGMEYEAFLAMYGLTDAKFDDIAKDQAKLYITAYALAKENSFEIDDTTMNTEWEAYIQEIMDSYDYTKEQAEEMIAEDERDMLKAELTYQAALKWLVEQNPQQ